MGTAAVTTAASALGQARALLWAQSSAFLPPSPTRPHGPVHRPLGGGAWLRGRPGGQAMLPLGGGAGIQGRVSSGPRVPPLTVPVLCRSRLKLRFRRSGV